MIPGAMGSRLPKIGSYLECCSLASSSFNLGGGAVLIEASIEKQYNRKAIQQPGEDILFNINDKRGTYGDNGGSFDLYLKVLS